MKIGIFSDFYYPSTNGVVFVVDILQKNLQKLGHKVLIVAPRPGLRARNSPEVKGVKVLWVPAIEGLLFDEYLTSVFTPTAITKKLEKEHLDIIIFITPGQIGLLGAYVAKRLDIPLVQQYSTDLISYVNHYKSSIPGIFALSLAAPITFKLKIDDIAQLSKDIIKGRKDKSLTIRQDIANKLLLTVHNNCDEIVAVSEKIAHNLKSNGAKVPIKVISTGVDKIAYKDTAISRKKLKIKEDALVILNVGRPTKEKNLELLIASFNVIADKNPNAILLIVGDSSYKKTLEYIANMSPYSERIIFTGKIKRNELSAIYSIADIFAFSSTTDTQGLVLNEAAHFGLPIVWCDPKVNYVARDHYNGLLAKNTVSSFSQKLNILLKSKKMRQKFSINSKKQAGRFTESIQTTKLESLLLNIIKKSK